MRRTTRVTLTLGALLASPLVVWADDKADVASGNTRFALELHQRLRGDDGNLIYSPFSLSTALAMTYAGARGDTADQMARTLRFPVKGDRLHPAYAALLKEVQGNPDKRPYQLHIANALWGQQGYPFQNEFLKQTHDHYGAGLREVDFVKDTEASRQTINLWVEKQTAEKIKDLIPKGILDDTTRLVLTNAVYFMGNWEYPFDPKHTRDGEFHLGDGKKVKAPLMNQTMKTRHAESDEVQALELPYKGKDLSMLVLLPGQGKKLADLEKGLTPAKLDDCVKGLREGKVIVTLPRFKISSAFSLKKQLSAMGMSLAFSRDADFSGINGRKDLYIAEVVHKGFIDVNELGTEATAATGVVIKEKSLPPQFTADRPFLFVIRDNRNGSILFMGRVVDPTKN